MIQADVSECKTLPSFYELIRETQCTAHGEHYCDQHDAVRQYLPSGGSYKELGTHQGATAANAVLCGAKQVTLVDISMGLFEPSRKLFEEYCEQQGTELRVWEKNSLDPATVSACDILLIDSYHTRAHMERELEVHAKYVKGHIVFHDTTHRPELFQGIRAYLSRHPEWELLDHQTESVGYTVIGRRQQ